MPLGAPIVGLPTIPPIAINSTRGRHSILKPVFLIKIRAIGSVASALKKQYSSSKSMLSALLLVLWRSSIPHQNLCHRHCCQYNLWTLPFLATCGCVCQDFFQWWFPGKECESEESWEMGRFPKLVIISSNHPQLSSQLPFEIINHNLHQSPQSLSL